MRKLLAVLIAALFAVPPIALADVTENIATPIYVDYDTTSTSLVYCKISPLVTNAPGSLVTSGSNTTTTSAAFFGVVQDEDILVVRQPTGTVLTRVIKTWTSTSTVVVNSVWTIAAGTKFSYRTYKTNGDVSGCGTAATNGWVYLKPGLNVISINVGTLGSTSVDYSVEGKMGGVGNGSDIIVIGAASISTATTASIPVTVPYQAVRVGLKLTGAGANLVNVVLNSQQ